MCSSMDYERTNVEQYRAQSSKKYRAVNTIEQYTTQYKYRAAHYSIIKMNRVTASL
jgi:hypothetical protein